MDWNCLQKMFRIPLPPLLFCIELEDDCPHPPPPLPQTILPRGLFVFPPPPPPFLEIEENAIPKPLTLPLPRRMPPPPPPFIEEEGLPPPLFPPYNPNIFMQEIYRLATATGKASCRDIYSILRNQPYYIQQATRMTIEEFDKFVLLCQAKIQRPHNIYSKFTRAEQLKRHYRRCGLDTKNRILFVLMWMSSYDVYWSLCITFGINIWTASRNIHHIVPILVDVLKDEVRWPILVECKERLGRFSQLFRDAIGAIDCTHHPICRPH
jgi:hypothetical protein